MFIHTYDEYWNQGHAVAAFSTPTIDQICKMKTWCRASYGEPGDRWLDQIIHGEVLFTDKRDLTLFVLRWS
jgi:hypothetical protein